jgi:hypothetical protein
MTILPQIPFPAITFNNLLMFEQRFREYLNIWGIWPPPDLIHLSLQGDDELAELIGKSSFQFIVLFQLLHSRIIVRQRILSQVLSVQGHN